MSETPGSTSFSAHAEVDARSCPPESVGLAASTVAVITVEAVGSPPMTRTGLIRSAQSVCGVVVRQPHFSTHAPTGWPSFVVGMLSATVGPPLIAVVAW